MEEPQFEFIIEFAQDIRTAILPHVSQASARDASRIAFSGDTTFEIDSVAEDALQRTIEQSHRNLAYFSEDKGLVKFGPQPQWLLIVDPIDGTRPLVCGLETAVVSIALCSYSKIATFGTILAGVVLEIKTGDWFYAERDKFVHSNHSTDSVVRLSANEDLARMFWSFDTIGRPAQRVMHYLADLIDSSGMAAAAFLFNSSAYSLTRIVTGQLDAYIDVGARILQDFPQSEAEFRQIGSDKIMGTFPYDLAGAYIILREAGGIITDAYGESLEEVFLIQQGKKAVLSCVAASNRKLHASILATLPTQHSLNLQS